MTTLTLPDPSVIAGLERLARTELSRGARLGHVLLALVASAMTIVVVSLLLTEPALPARTVAAFGLLAVIGMGWLAYSVWVLRARRVMLARQRVVAGRLAVAFTGAFTAGCVVLAAAAAVPAAWPAAAMGGVLLAVAFVLWRRAGAAHAALLARRAALERTVAGGATIGG
jgi:hypothetical protein